MNNKAIVLFFSIIIISGFLYSQEAVESASSRCDIPIKARYKIERWLNKIMNEVKKAVKDGRMYDNRNHKLPPCKIIEIESLYKNLIFEYDCKCGVCGQGGTSHRFARDRPFIRICQPLSLILDEEKDLNKTSSKLCGCIQGLIVHELTHATVDHTEEGATDCARILYPCESDAWGVGTDDHRNCTCCEEEGK